MFNLAIVFLLIFLNKRKYLVAVRHLQSQHLTEFSRNISCTNNTVRKLIERSQ